MTTYQMTERGMEQIRQWLLQEWNCEAGDVGDLNDAVHAYARMAEDAEDGEIELRAWQTASGRIAYLRPERQAVKREYTYRTDGEMGEIDAVDFADACAQLDAMFTPAVIADGGWGWVDDCDGEQPRYEIGSWR
jgi:hypothetical protein